jgi:hypothetical protein
MNGDLLTLKVPESPFATEGPIWDIDTANHAITVTGKTLTFPRFLDGQHLELNGSSAFGQDGEAETGINATTFDRLLDINATDRDVVPARQGATRSLFSTSETRRVDATKPASRNLQAYQNMKANYFRYVKAAAAKHTAVLPTDFLDRAGIGREGGDLYPVTAGATLKSAGHIYLGPDGKEYYITDIEAVLELSENVASGKIISIDGGDAVTPASFVIGDLLIIMNQDPRFGAHIFGLAEMDIPLDIFVSQGKGKTVDTIGHTVGEHVLFVQEIISDLIDTTQGIIVMTERWRLDDGANRIRFRGHVSQVNVTGQTGPCPPPATGNCPRAEVALQVKFFDANSFQIGDTLTAPLDPPGADLVLGVGAGAPPGAVFDFRSRDEINVAAVSTVDISLVYLYDGTNVSTDTAFVVGETAFTETIFREEVVDPLP